MTRTPAPVRPAPQVTKVPDELRQLVDAVEDIPAATADPDHSKIVAALSLVAKLIRPDDPEAARTIDTLATQLMRSPPNERTHSDIARDALAAAFDSHVNRFAMSPKQDIRDAYVAGRRALASISDREPLRFQLHEVAAASRALANLEALARGLDPVFTPVYEEVDVGHAPAEMRTRIARASELVSALAAERKWADAARLAASALDVLADTIEVSPLALDVLSWQSLVNAIRYEAVQLARQSTISLDRSDRIKGGLAACVKGLRSLAVELARPESRAFIERADAAVNQIDTSTPFILQRAIIQESFRTVVDALLVATATDGDSVRMSSTRMLSSTKYLGTRYSARHEDEGAHQSSSGSANSL
jgi:hypothetical protein